MNTVVHEGDFFIVIKNTGVNKTTDCYTNVEHSISQIYKRWISYG